TLPIVSQEGLSPVLLPASQWVMGNGQCAMESRPRAVCKPLQAGKWASSVWNIPQGLRKNPKREGEAAHCPRFHHHKFWDESETVIRRGRFRGWAKQVHEKYRTRLRSLKALPEKTLGQLAQVDGSRDVALVMIQGAGVWLIDARVRLSI